MLAGLKIQGTEKRGTPNAQRNIYGLLSFQVAGQNGRNNGWQTYNCSRVITVRNGTFDETRWSNLY